MSSLPNFKISSKLHVNSKVKINFEFFDLKVTVSFAMLVETNHAKNFLA